MLATESTWSGWASLLLRVPQHLFIGRSYVFFQENNRTVICHCQEQIWCNSSLHLDPVSMMMSSFTPIFHSASVHYCDTGTKVDAEVNSTQSEYLWLGTQKACQPRRAPLVTYELVSRMPCLLSGSAYHWWIVHGWPSDLMVKFKFVQLFVNMATSRLLPQWPCSISLSWHTWTAVIGSSLFWNMPTA